MDCEIHFDNAEQMRWLRTVTEYRKSQRKYTIIMWYCKGEFGCCNGYKRPGGDQTFVIWFAVFV